MHFFRRVAIRRRAAPTRLLFTAVLRRNECDYCLQIKFYSPEFEPWHQWPTKRNCLQPSSYKKHLNPNLFLLRQMKLAAIDQVPNRWEGSFHCGAGALAIDSMCAQESKRLQSNQVLTPQFLPPRDAAQRRNCA